MTKVIFRKFKNGQIIALFPQEPATGSGWECMSYMHICQHGDADPRIVNDTKPATPLEYSELYNELKKIGYNDLSIYKKFTKEDYKIRKEKVKEIMRELTKSIER